jgi:hypothetical protein
MEAQAWNTQLPAQGSIQAVHPSPGKLQSFQRDVERRFTFQWSTITRLWMQLWAIITRGSVCWTARLFPDTDSQMDSQLSSQLEYTYIIKDQWRAAERTSECEIISDLSSAQSKDLEAAPFGLPCYLWYGEHEENGAVVDVLGSVRKGLFTQMYDDMTSAFDARDADTK